MTSQTYFYKFIEPLSKELAIIARELENSIFTSPRTMLTHARTFIEAIIDKVLVKPKRIDYVTYLAGAFMYIGKNPIDEWVLTSWYETVDFADKGNSNRREIFDKLIKPYSEF